MAKTTAYMVQAFERQGKTRLKALTAMRASNEQHADRMAERLARNGGAVAVCQSGDPETGEYGEARIIGVYGDLPDGLLDTLLTA
jgi:hypothetical protein